MSPAEPSLVDKVLDIEAMHDAGSITPSGVADTLRSLLGPDSRVERVVALDTDHTGR